MILVAAKVLAKRDHRYLPSGWLSGLLVLGLPEDQVLPPFPARLIVWRGCCLDARRSCGDVVSPATGVR